MCVCVCVVLPEHMDTVKCQCVGVLQGSTVQQHPPPLRKTLGSMLLLQDCSPACPLAPAAPTTAVICWRFAPQVGADKPIQVANFLCPGNYAVSGSIEGCEAVERLGKDPAFKARMTVSYNVTLLSTSCTISVLLV